MKGLLASKIAEILNTNNRNEAIGIAESLERDFVTNFEVKEAARSLTELFKTPVAIEYLNAKEIENVETAFGASVIMKVYKDYLS